MTARKAWLLGVAGVVITLLSLGWFMLNRPPFRFLTGATLAEMDISPPAMKPASTTLETIFVYQGREPFDRLVAEIKRELLAEGFELLSEFNTSKETAEPKLRSSHASFQKLSFDELVVVSRLDGRIIVTYMRPYRATDRLIAGIGVRGYRSEKP